MKKITKITLMALAALLLFSSCNFNSAEPPISFIDSTNPTWKDVFEAYWNGLNNNYIFWNVDSPSNEWDEIYDEYVEEFEKLGPADYLDPIKTATAIQFLMHMSYDLSDGHYAMEIKNDATGGTVTFSPSNARFFEKNSKKELTRVQIVNDMYNGTPIFNVSESTSVGQEWQYETTQNHLLKNLLENESELQEYEKCKTFGCTSDGLLSLYGLTAPEYEWNKGPSFFTEESFDELFKEWMVIKQDSLFAVAGITKAGVKIGEQSVPENCLYFGFNSFSFINGLLSSEVNPIPEFVKIFTLMKQDENLVGMVVDLRGNGGGASPDKELLFGDLVPADQPFHYANEIYKVGNNRLDYTAPVPMYLYRGDLELLLGFKPLDQSSLFNKPIVAITNAGTVSNGEITAIMISEFPKGAIVGTNSWGGIGELTGQNKPNHNAGEFTVGSYISTVYTPYTRVETLDGKCYEGTGVVPDIPVEFDLEKYLSGNDLNDLKLAAAFKYIADNQ